jgi:muconolactone delta-isomerase
MEFLVSIIPHIPPATPKEQIADLLAQETDAAVDLMRRGILKRIDRAVGRGGNYSVWEVDSLEQLGVRAAEGTAEGMLLPLPLGEGWGEGTCQALSS